MSKLDKIDIRILKELQNNAGITNLELSERVYLSPSACLVRVQKLRESGMIERDVSLIVPSKIGLFLHSFLEISSVNHSLNDQK